MTYTLDTSGCVDTHPGDNDKGYSVWWHTLTPFTRGYVEALLRDTPAAGPLDDLRWPAFSDLAPETLAGVIEDCEARFTGWVLHPNNAAVRSDDATEGRRFWTDRQSGAATSFSPLTVLLGDDGKVRFT